LLPLNLGGAHGQKQRFRSLQGADLLRQLSAGDSGHLQIYQQHIRAGVRIGCQQLEGGSGVVRAQHLVALVSKDHSHQFKAYGIIVHQQNFVPGLESSRPGYQRGMLSLSGLTLKIKPFFAKRYLYELPDYTLVMFGKRPEIWPLRRRNALESLLCLPRTISGNK